jgi:HAD superfamily hydrolase (TIGR01509 family)
VNGVLVDAVAIGHQAFLATAARYGFPCRDPEFRAIKGLWLLEAYRRLDPGSDPQARRAFHLRYVRERIAEVRAYPGVHETLAAARSAGVRIGAATSHGEIAEACLVRTDLYPLIDCLVTQEEVRRPKPHPDLVLRALQLLSGERDHSGADAIYVGDTIEDMQAGHAAGVLTIGVTYGVLQDAEIRMGAPHHVIQSFHEMRTWLRDVGGASFVPRQDGISTGVESIPSALET